MTGLIILAAGESGRLGQPKQNLLFNGETLLQHAFETGKKSGCSPIIIMLGANAESITPIAEAITLYNPDWKEGMSSSIRAAMAEINKNTLIDKAIIMLCDQPFVSATILKALIEKQLKTGKPIVACTYNGAIGVPALFERKFFTELLLLTGQQGAKNILNMHPDDVATISFEQGVIDIDTPGDYEQLRKLSD